MTNIAFTGGLALGGAIGLAFATPAAAGWDRISAARVEIAKGAFSAQPSSEWNRASRRPSAKGETWTKDGFQLNRLDFMGQIAPGETIYKDRQKKERPLAKFAANMLPTDLADLFESNFSVEHDVTQFDVVSLAPAKLGSHDGIRLEYRYALPNDSLTRVGEARLAVVGNKLYLVNFTAPQLHYFGASIAEVRAIMDGATVK